MFDQFRLSIMTFPQRINGTTLSVNVLVLPQIGTQWGGNPLLDLPLGFPLPTSTGAPFAESNLPLELRIMSGLDDFPRHDPVDAALPLGTAATFPDAVALFTELQNQFQIKSTIAATDLAEAPKASLKVRKYVAPSYRNAAGFIRARIPEIVTDDSYECAIKESKAPNPAFVPTSDEVTWGKVFAYCLRHSLLARRLGLIREASINVDVSLFEEGGFIYATLAEGSSYLDGIGPDDQFNFIRHYAARIPALEQGSDRPLFAQSLFPVLFGVTSPDGNYDQVFIDAAEYDDGFAKIVHTSQPISQNLLAEEDDGFPPLHDIGIRAAWDDERVCEWQNRQLKEREDQPGKRLDAPMGVFGYRVDVRPQGQTPWHSLNAVQSKAALQLGPVNLGSFEGELAVEVHPMQLDGDQANGEFWLPVYFTQWNGKSLVLPDEDAAALYQTEQAASQAVVLGRMYNPVGIDAVPLRYGDIYEFRVRLMDATSGGPDSQQEPVYESPAPIATAHFKRFVQPEPLRVAGVPLLPDEPLDTYFAGDSLSIQRPLLGYPSVIFTGKYTATDPIPLLQAASDAAAGVGSFGIPDPDVLHVQIDVEVRSLKMDNTLSLSGKESFIHLYTTSRDFPADFAATLEIPLDFRQANVLNFGDPHDLGDLGVSEDDLMDMNELVLPRGREIRLTLRGVGDADSDYYGTPRTHVGKSIQVKVRRESEDERDLLADLSEARQIRGMYLQPDPPQPNDGRLKTWLFQRGAAATPAMIQRLAQQLDVDDKGLTLVGQKGQRVIFGCSNRIRHTLAPDNSSLTFASKEELLNHWIVALTYQVDRDWTWDMLQEVSFEIFREFKFAGDEEVDDNNGQPIGDFEMKRTAPINALQNPDRSKTTLIYLDAVEPKSNKPNPDFPGETAFPDVIQLSYSISPNFSTVPAQQDSPESIALELPVTTPPAQVPRIVSAGIALSKYQRSDDYSATEPRERFLWLELDEPVRDPHDAYFIRILGYAPDPLLSDDRLETFVPPDEPPLNIDPELIRVITPGQSDDLAGLSAMAPLEPATNSDRHFLVPLPPGLHAESNELFGFFTYELRVGHADIWSTAQGRFGRALRTTGVQHPAPTLFCTCHRDEVHLLVEAPHAMAVLNGKNLTATPPRTEIWALLYAQVRQADGLDNRNILLDDRRLNLIPRVYHEVVTPEGTIALAKSNRNGPAWSSTEWDDGEIKALLDNLGLPVDASLSVICVELMPHFGSFQQQPNTSITGYGVTSAQESVVEGVGFIRGNSSAPGAAATQAQVDELRPLSNLLGHFRLLRTSQLTPVPDVC